MQPTGIILKKRLGGALSREEIQAFVRGAVDGSFADYQLAALLMAICIQGMSPEETLELTMAMAHSGEMLDLSGVDGITVDKHSTGGVGDTTTLILAPLAAACGAKVAKMSGRGLGHTGGTLDKLEAIPGFCVEQSPERFIEIVNRVGCAVVGQSRALAPADKKLYALRDVTATVDSLPLITSSILSKKIASGCQAVVLDVKSGSGALMDTLEHSIELAEAMVRIGCMTGRRFSALVTDMDQPLGMNIGNALEVEEAIHTLRGEVDGPLLEVSALLGAHMLVEAGLASGVAQGQALVRAQLASGAGLEKFAAMIEAQGGDPRVTEDTGRLPQPERVLPVRAERTGYVGKMHAACIGNASRLLGAGRLRAEDAIDPAAGIVMKKRVGDPVEAGEPLCELHAGRTSDVAGAEALMRQAVEVWTQPVTPPALVHAVVTREGTKNV